MCGRLAMYCSVSQHPVSGVQGTEVIAEWGLARQASYTMATHRGASRLLCTPQPQQHVEGGSSSSSSTAEQSRPLQLYVP